MFGKKDDGLKLKDFILSSWILHFDEMRAFLFLALNLIDNAPILAKMPNQGYYLCISSYADKILFICEFFRIVFKQFH